MENAVGGARYSMMPRYVSHKTVWALKIKAIEYSIGYNGAILHFEKEQYRSVQVDADYLNRHRPQSGGYFVLYEGGYISWSPADVFEAGYTLAETTIVS